MNYYFNEETIEYFHNRSYLIDDAEELYEEMWNFVNVDYDTDQFLEEDIEESILMELNII